MRRSTAATWFVPAAAPVVPAAGDRVPHSLPARPRARRGAHLRRRPARRGTPAVLDAARAARGGRHLLPGRRAGRAPARRWPARSSAEGHEVALHGYRHTLLLRRADAGARGRPRPLRRRDRARRPASRRRSTARRTASSARAALAHVRERGWRPLLWSTWGRDWRRRTSPDEIARLATRGLRRGDVVLLHDSDAYSSAGLLAQDGRGGAVGHRRGRGARRAGRSAITQST